MNEEKAVSVLKLKLTFACSLCHFFFEFWIVSGPLLIDFHLIDDSITLFYCHVE